MFQTFEQAQKYVLDNQIEMVDLKFCDLWGRWHHLTIPSSQFVPELMEKGIGFDGSAVGLKSVKAGDMVLVPDLGTAFVDPFWDGPTLSFICITLEADTHAIFENDPRNIAIRAEEYMQSTGVADGRMYTTLPAATVACRRRRSTTGGVLTHGAALLAGKTG